MEEFLYLRNIIEIMEPTKNKTVIFIYLQNIGF